MLCMVMPEVEPSNTEARTNDDIRRLALRIILGILRIAMTQMTVMIIPPMFVMLSMLAGNSGIAMFDGLMCAHFAACDDVVCMRVVDTCSICAYQSTANDARLGMRGCVGWRAASLIPRINMFACVLHASFQYRM